MTNNPPIAFHTVISEETSFKRVIGPTGQEALEVEIESIVKSLAGVTETRSQSFALAGNQAAKLLAALQTITENMLNLVEKSSQEAMRRYEEAHKEDKKDKKDKKDKEDNDTEENAVPDNTDSDKSKESSDEEEAVAVANE